jgi:hypothetical protein
MQHATLKACLLAGAMTLLVMPAAASAQIMGAYSAPQDQVVENYKAPLTSWGKPDISGNWTNSTLTPENRPEKYGNRLIMTKAETAELEGASDALIALGNKPTDPNATVKDLPADCSGGRGTNCNYNAAFTDPGSVVMRVKGQPRSSLITTETGREPPRKAGAPEPTNPRGANQRAGVRQNDNPEGRSLGERCILSFGRSAGPPMFDQLYNSNYQFVLSKDNLAILVEMVHDTRIIRIGDKHRTDGVRPYMGDSIGWWEGDTFVSETTNIPRAQAYHGSWEHLKVTEKFTRVAPGRMNYKFIIEDPTMWDKPWTGEYEFGTASGAVYEYACHEGNYGLQNILGGAREEDRMAAESQAKPTASR